MLTAKSSPTTPNESICSQTLVHAEQGFSAATCEIMQLHVDMTTRRAAPFPEDRMGLVAACAAAHARLPRPERAGRRVGIPAPLRQA